MRATSTSGVRRDRATFSVACLLLALAAMLLAPATAAQSPAAPQRSVVVLDVDGAIGPAMSEYVRDGIESAQRSDVALIVLRMDTPGGLDTSMRDIISAILASRTPVATYVGPAGARAASAGTYILYASHLAAMAPATHLGAATPVQIGGEPTRLPGAPEPQGDEKAAPEGADAMSSKIVNDATAYIASLAGLQGRNAEWAERAVREAATLTAEQALANHVIEVVAPNLDALLRQADGRTVQLSGQPYVLKTAGAQLTPVEPGWRTRVLAVITDPNIAFVLMLVGMYGLLFEFLSPGAIAPGVIGGIALLVALFALNVLPVNFAGLALLLLGIGLMTAEAMTPSIGALGAGGAVAFGLGALFLFRGPLPEFRISPGVALASAALSFAFFAIALHAVLRSRRAPVAIGPAALAAATGAVVSWSGAKGVVHVEGEDWQARSTAPLSPGQAVRVTGRDGISLMVDACPSPADTDNPQPR